MIKKQLRLSAIVTFFVLSTSCTDSEDSPIPDSGFYISSNAIYQDGEIVNYYGVNAMQSFGLNDPNLMNEWKVEITREFIGNFREQPFTGGAIQASDGVWYHPLQQIVDQNRANDRVTILCPFGWVNSSGEQTLLTGLNPSSQNFYDDYKTRLLALSNHFNDQPDVWIEVWNEPYHWNNENDYSHDLWLADMTDLITVVRSVSKSIVVVPGNEQGQSENVLLEKGQKINSEFQNIIFDLHAYEKWMIDVSEKQIEDRLVRMEQLGLAVLFGEVGVVNSSGLMDVNPFLNTASKRNLSLLGWLWTKSDSYQNALLNENGLVNDVNNLNWGSTFKSVLQNKEAN
jgi:mannan endo-1,4-beta-mannosidase